MTAEHQMQQRLEELGRKLSEEGSIAESVMQRIGEQASKPQPASRVNVWRIAMRNRTMKYAAAAVIFIGVLVGVFQFANVGGPGVAFADVIQHILNARTIIYDVFVGDEENVPATHDLIMGSRIRRTLPNLPNTVYLIDLDEMSLLVLDEENQKAVYTELKGVPQQPQNHIEVLRNLLNELHENPHFIVEELGEAVVDGRKAIGFRGVCPGVTIVVWADVQTELPFRLEMEQGQLRVVLKNMEFDVPVDEELFRMEIPKGYTLQETELNLTGATEDDFIEGLRVRTEIVGKGIFPDSVAIEDYMKEIAEVKKRFDEMGLSDEQELELAMKIEKHLLFLRYFKGQGKWYYHGKGVQLGDSEAVVFWYRPQGSDTWRVIYGDLTVDDAATEDLPEPPEEQRQETLAPQVWSARHFVGNQKDRWHVKAGGQLEGHVELTLTKVPAGADAMEILLPYTQAELVSVSVDQQEAAFEHMYGKKYKVWMPMEKILAGERVVHCVWTMPLDELEKAGYGFRAVLQGLIPVGAYHLTIVLEDGCGYEYTSNPGQREYVPFCTNSDEANIQFGSCGLVIRPVE